MRDRIPGSRGTRGSRLRGRTRPGYTCSQPDAGFLLVETLIAVVLLGVVTAAVVPLMIGVIRSTAGLGVKQIAVTVASQQMEYVRSLPAAKLTSGRSAVDVAALNADPGSVNLTADLLDVGNFDAAAVVGSANALVRLSDAQTRDGTTFTVRTFVNVCRLNTTSGDCTRTGTGPSLFRVTVAVSWPRSPEVQCVTGYRGGCEFTTTTLVDASVDPVFVNKAAPVITSISLSRTVNGVSTPVTSGYAWQEVTVTVIGTGFDPGAGLTSTLGDQPGSVTTNTGTLLMAPLVISNQSGARQLTVLNPDGSSATGTYSITVVPSSPTVAWVPPIIANRGVPTTFVISGSDFYASPSATNPTTPPTVTFTFATVYPGRTVTASKVTLSGTSQLTVTVTPPPADTGLGFSALMNVTVTNPDGRSASPAVLMLWTIL